MAFALSVGQGGTQRLVLSWVLSTSWQLRSDGCGQGTEDWDSRLDRWGSSGLPSMSTLTRVYIGQEPGLGDVNFDFTVERANHRCWVPESTFINVVNKWLGVLLVGHSTVVWLACLHCEHWEEIEIRIVLYSWGRWFGRFTGKQCVWKRPGTECAVKFNKETQGLKYV